MEHILVRLGSRRVLIAAPGASSFGKPVGYGVLIRRVREAFLVAHGNNARLLMIPSRHPANRALFDLTSLQVPAISPRSAEGMVWRLFWAGLRPVRHGAPIAWALSHVGRLFRVAARWLVRTEIARRPRRRRQTKALAKRLEAWGSLRTNQFATLVRQKWSGRIREAGKRTRKAERADALPALTIGLRSEVEARVSKAAARAGIDPGATIVSLHVREGGYRRARGMHERATDDARNARIDRYAPAIDWLAAQGAIIVRLGDPTMTPLARPGVVDMATSTARSPELDLWVVSKSRLFIASDSGPYYLARLFGVPSLAVNVIQFMGYSWGAQDRFICKMAIDRMTGRQLTISEMLDEPYLGHALDLDRYRHEENAPEDILAAAQEAWQTLHGTPCATPRQRAFDAKLRSLIEQRNELALDPRTALIVTQGRGSISASFAERYFGNNPVPGVDVHSAARAT